MLKYRRSADKAPAATKLNGSTTTRKEAAKGNSYRVARDEATDVPIHLLKKGNELMSDSMFAPKENIPPAYQPLEVLSVEKTDTYGPQVSFKLKVIGGKHAGHTFVDYATRDEDTGQIKQGTKAWSIYEACLGQHFHKKIKGLDDIVGKRFVAKVEQTKTGSRNKVEFGTAGPVPAGGFNVEDDGLEPPDFKGLAG